MEAWTACFASLAQEARNTSQDLPVPPDSLENIEVKLSGQSAISLELFRQVFFDLRALTGAAAIRACGDVRRHRFVNRSLYAPQVFHWLRIFGAENIKIVTLERISSEGRAQVLSEIFDFLGLCRGEGVVLSSGSGSARHLKINPKMQRNATPEKKIPKEYQMSELAFEALHNFYSGFNEVLFLLAGERYEWGPEYFRGRHRFPAKDAEGADRKVYAGKAQRRPWQQG
mmetsp:Transcript_17099/g.65202  ORF Transcript_17099/g.65202 Transcript_17099/m.65202 type:complete len:228 (+) Transcript_17099:2201-2884(+)